MIVLTCVLIPTSLIYSNGLDTNSNIKSSSIKANTVKQHKIDVYDSQLTQATDDLKLSEE